MILAEYGVLDALAHLAREPFFLAITLGPLSLVFALLFYGQLKEAKSKHRDGLGARRVLAVFGRTAGTFAILVLGYGAVAFFHLDPTERAMNKQWREYEEKSRELDETFREMEATQRRLQDSERALKALDAWIAAQGSGSTGTAPVGTMVVGGKK